MPRRARGTKVMKGRPLTDAEFRKLLATVPNVVAEPEVDAWRFYLQGLWWSGLRVGESLELYWDRRNRLRVDLSGRFATLHVPAELEKGNKDRILPVAPEFADMLREVAKDDRHGLVFALAAPEGRGKRAHQNRIMKTAAKIGETAGIVVNENGRGGKPKHATLHDLRRSFACRWADRLPAHQLQEIMRHESIITTQKYYVGQNAERTAEAMARATAPVSDRRNGGAESESKDLR